MDIVRANNECVELGSLKFGECFYRDAEIENIYIKGDDWDETIYADDEKKRGKVVAVSCMNVHNGHLAYFGSDEKVYRIRCRCVVD